MGSFNVSCCVSNLTIAPGTPAVFLPLRRNVDNFFKEFGVIFDAPFTPYPPLRGIYNDYGRLCDLQPSSYHDSFQWGDNFKSLALGDDRKEIGGYTYTWVRGEIWDHMVNHGHKGFAGIVSKSFDNYADDEKLSEALVDAGLSRHVSAEFQIKLLEHNLGMTGVLTPMIKHLRAIKPEIIALAKFIGLCFSCNILLAPVPCGPQGGDLTASKHLAQAIYSVATQDLNTYNDTRNEEEEE